MSDEKKGKQRFYIGNGKKNAHYPTITDVSIDIEEAMKFAFKKDGKTYIKFAVAPKNPNGPTDKWGRTHNIYVFDFDPADKPLPEAQPTQTIIAERSVKELKAILKGRKLKVSGSRAELVARVTEALTTAK